MARAIGVEIAPAGVRGVILEQRAGRCRLVASRELTCDTSRVEALARALGELRRALPAAGPIVLGIPSSSAIVSTVNPLIVNARRAGLAVQFELEQQLPFRLADAAWHYDWLGDENGRGAKPADTRSSPLGLPRRALSQPPPAGAIVTATRRSLLEQQLLCCRRAGFEVRQVAVSPVAALNAWFAGQATERREPVALICLLNDQMAEWVVWAPSALEVMPVRAGSADELCQQITATWDALRARAGHAPGPVRAIAPAGLLAPLQACWSQAFGSPLEPFDMGKVLAGAGSAAAPQTAAIGLALQGLGVARLALNLLAGSQGEARARRLRQGMAAASIGLALATGFVGFSGMLQVRERSLRVLRDLQRQERLYEALRPEVRTLLRRQQRMERRARQLEALAAEGALLPRLLAAAVESLPERVWLTKLECAKVAAPAAPDQGEASGVFLEGRAHAFQDVTLLLDRLKTVGGMTSVKPVSTEVVADPVSGKELVAFSVQAQRPGAAAVAQPDAEAPEPPGASNDRPSRATRKAR